MPPSVFGERVRMEIRPNGDESRAMTLEYQYPLSDVSTSSRTAKHDVLGEQTVVDHLGSTGAEIKFRGHCYKDEAVSFIDRLSEIGVVQVLSDRWSGWGVVDSANTSVSGEHGGKRPDFRNPDNQNLEYWITILETQNPNQ